MDNQKKRELMSFWLFGTFIIVIVAVTVFAYMVPEVGTRIFSEMNYWIFVVATAVLCVAGYFIYGAILNREDDDDGDEMGGMEHMGGMEE
ncbi:MAG: hypothetical protein FVQ83_07240 [Chloroflexi bacterium]|nr:hypothetical protein [Chloroflexota bacterium]